MKRRPVHLQVSDHAVLRYLERGHGLDVEQVRNHLRGRAMNAASLGALAVKVENVRLFLREMDVGGGRSLVIMSTVGTKAMVPIAVIQDEPPAE